jgi:hypothetical protein
VGLHLLDVDHREEEPTERGVGCAHPNQRCISHGFIQSAPDDLGPLDTAVIDGHEPREACPLSLLRAGLRRQVEEASVAIMPMPPKVTSMSMAEMASW